MTASDSFFTWKQIIRPDQNPNCLTLMVHVFLKGLMKNLILKKKSASNKNNVKVSTCHAKSLAKSGVNLLDHLGFVVRNQTLLHVNNKGADQPVHPHSQISTFVIH